MGKFRSKSTRRRTLRRNKKTRKQKGGADIKRLQRNVIAASKLGSADDSNLYYFPSDEDITKGNGLVIAPRYSGITDADRRSAKYPYEECLFFFDVNLGADAPNDYPNGPPILKHQTPGIFKNYRLHPNLYEHNYAMPQYSGKVCLGILGTWGKNDWEIRMSISEVLQGIMGILEANPGTYEPGCGFFTDKQPQGVLYNTHIMYESIQTTCKAYEKVFKAVTLGSNGSPKFNNANVRREGIPDFMKPFLDVLAKRGFSALTFLIGKVDEFIRVHGKSSLSLQGIMHHQPKIADFAALKTCLEGVKALIPKPLQKNVFKYGIGETHRALFELSKPKWKDGTPKTYEEFVKEIQQMEQEKLEAEKAKKRAEMGVNSCPSEAGPQTQTVAAQARQAAEAKQTAANQDEEDLLGDLGHEENENTTSFVYSNYGNEDQVEENE